VAKFADGKWHSFETIAKATGAIGAPAESVGNVLHNICTRGGYDATGEKKRVGKEMHYRIFKQDKTVGLDELTEKLKPIIEGLKVEGRKNAATVVISNVAMLAVKLERLLDELAE
jgi:hypothetical protein